MLVVATVPEELVDSEELVDGKLIVATVVDAGEVVAFVVELGA